MKIKLTILAVAASILVVMGVWLTVNMKDSKMAAPKFNEELGIKIIPTSLPTPTIKQFKFDFATDLNEELKSIDPQLLDSDFEE